MARTGIWRIEHSSDFYKGDYETPAGPYDNSYYVGVLLQRAHNFDAAHPGPGFAICAYHLCGVRDFPELLHWFGGWFKLLQEDGFMLSYYECPTEDVVVSRLQLLFDCRSASRLRRLPLDLLVLADARSGRSADPLDQDEDEEEWAF